MSLSQEGERRLRGLLLAELQRKLHPAHGRGPVSRVDQLEYRPAVRTALLRYRPVEDAADEVIHLLRNAGVPQLVEDGERPAAGIGGLLAGISVADVAVGRQGRAAHQVGIGDSPAPPA